MKQVAESLWNYYALSLHLEDIAGGIPRHPEIIRRWQESRAKKLVQGDTVDEAVKRTVEELGAEALEDEAAMWNGFKEHEGMLVIEARQVKASIKEAANILKSFFRTDKDKVPYLRSLVAERVFVQPRFISLGVSEPSHTEERPIHVMTARGPRDALKRTDIVEDVKIECSLRVLNDGVITEEMLVTLFEYAGENGLGGDRSQGRGVFQVVEFGGTEAA